MITDTTGAGKFTLPVRAKKAVRNVSVFHFFRIDGAVSRTICNNNPGARPVSSGSGRWYRRSGCVPDCEPGARFETRRRWLSFCAQRPRSGLCREEPVAQRPSCLLVCIAGILDRYSVWRARWTGLRRVLSHSPAPGLSRCVPLWLGPQELHLRCRRLKRQVPFRHSRHPCYEVLYRPM